MGGGGGGVGVIRMRIRGKFVLVIVQCANDNIRGIDKNFITTVFL